jgi:predicted acetyltransferase
MAELVLPDSRYRESYLAALEEFHSEGRNLEWDLAQLRHDFSVLLQRLDKNSRGLELPPGHVPSTQYWLVEGDEYLGRANIRHHLSPDLEILGGNIGYEIRPSARGKGYGHQVFREALRIARTEFGIDLALVTCDATNEASKRIIRAEGGVLIYPPGHELRFWVPT